MPENPGATVTPDRRQRYRLFMKRFNPTLSPKTAIGKGLIHDDPGLFRKLAAGADLDPGSQQLIVGGIGSGKTTQLLLAERELAAHELAVPLYIDVAAATDLSQMNSGALLASLGVRLSEVVTSRFSPDQIQSSGDLPKAFQAINRAA